MPINKFGTDRTIDDRMKLRTDVSLLRVRMHTVSQQSVENVRLIEVTNQDIKDIERKIDEQRVRMNAVSQESTIFIATIQNYVRDLVGKLNTQRVEINKLKTQIQDLEKKQ